MVAAVLDSLDIRSYFGVVATACEVAAGKPAPDIYLKVAADLGVQPEKCLVFEDVPAGILAGKRAGMRVGAVEDVFSLSMIEEKKELADFYIRDYRELIQGQDKMIHDFYRSVGRIWTSAAGRAAILSTCAGMRMSIIRRSAHAIISRMLEAHGYKVGIIAQPDWKNQESIQILGEPRLGWLVSAGNMDSMVNHYSVSKKRRAKDSYTPGGEMGKRPDYATIVYSNLIRTWSKKPIILGGIEASLRRPAHYDYWSGKMKRSILLDSQADLISYGMGERSIVEIADALASGIEAKDITFIEGTVYKAENLDSVYDEIRLPSYREVSSDKKTYAESFTPSTATPIHFRKTPR